MHLIAERIGLLRKWLWPETKQPHPDPVLDGGPVSEKVEKIKRLCLKSEGFLIQDV